MTFIFYSARVFGTLSGLFLLYLAFSLYEDEEKRIQSRLQDFWCRIDDAPQRHYAAVKETFAIVDLNLKRLLGPPMLSLRFCTISFGLQTAGAALLIALAQGSLLTGIPLHRLQMAAQRQPPLNHTFQSSIELFQEVRAGLHWWVPILFGTAGVLLVWLALVGVKSSSWIIRYPATIIIWIIALSLMLAPLVASPKNLSARAGTFGVTWTVVFLLSTILLLINRRIIVQAARSPLSPKLYLLSAIALFVSICCSIPGLFTIAAAVDPTSILSLSESESSAAFVKYSVMTNSVLPEILIGVGFYCLPSSLPVAMTASVGMLLAMHRISFPLLNRIVYNVHRHNLIAQKKLIAKFAIALLIVSLAPYATILTWLAKATGL